MRMPGRAVRRARLARGSAPGVVLLRLPALACCGSVMCHLDKQCVALSHGSLPRRSFVIGKLMRTERGCNSIQAWGYCAVNNHR